MKNFRELNLSPALSTAIEELGYETPTPIQAQTIPLLLEGPTDFLGLAATGTGKTAAFGIPLLEQLNNSRQEVQALVLCPTRELALQVTEQLNLLGKHKKLRAIAIYGGAGYGDQIRGIKSGAQIIVATPGRLIDHLERRTIVLEKLKTIVLDEADEMISMGFKDEIETILETIPNPAHNTWFFSATMSKDVRKVADRFLTNPKTVQANKSEMLSGTVRQIYYKVKERDKTDILCKLIDLADDFYGLIFCQTKSLVMDLTALLSARGYKVDCLHGDKDQNQRERTMKAFRERRISVVVCTDVAARGIDVKDLTHVINYSIPRELDNYVHRIGRTGRSGKAGLALSLVTPSHMSLIGRIEQMTKSKFELGAIPSRKDIAAKKLAKCLERFQGVTTHARAQELLTEPWLAAFETMSKNEIAGRLLVLAFPEIFVDRDKEKAQDASATILPTRIEIPRQSNPGERRHHGRSHEAQRGFHRPRRHEQERRHDHERRDERPNFSRRPWEEAPPVAAVDVSAQRVRVKPLERPIASDQGPGSWKKRRFGKWPEKKRTKFAKKDRATRY